jgi:hypothetical protein
MLSSELMKYQPSWTPVQNARRPVYDKLIRSCPVKACLSMMSSSMPYSSSPSFSNARRLSTLLFLDECVELVDFLCDNSFFCTAPWAMVGTWTPFLRSSRAARCTVNTETPSFCAASAAFALVSQALRNCLLSNVRIPFMTYSLAGWLPTYVVRPRNTRSKYLVLS